MDLQEKYNIQIEILASQYNYSADQLRNAKLYYRLLRQEQNDMKGKRVNPQGFFLYTVFSSGDFKDSFTYEISMLSARIDEYEELVEEEKAENDIIVNNHNVLKELGIGRESRGPIPDVEASRI